MRALVRAMLVAYWQACFPQTFNDQVSRRTIQDCSLRGRWLGDLHTLAQHCVPATTWLPQFVWQMGFYHIFQGCQHFARPVLAGSQRLT